MDLKEFILKNGAITKSKGFDVSQHFPQMLLIVDEVFEALEHLVDKNKASQELYMTYTSIDETMKWFREVRKTKDVFDPTKINNMDKYLEELADIFIRLMSYVEQFGYEKFEKIILNKMEKNKTRPIRHGKKF